MKKLRETAEIFALNMWLSDYPSNLSYDEIIARIISGDYLEHEIVIWQRVENCPKLDLFDMIEDTRCAFENYAAELIAPGVSNDL